MRRLIYIETSGLVTIIYDEAREEATYAGPRESGFPTG